MGESGKKLTSTFLAKEDSFFDRLLVSLFPHQKPNYIDKISPKKHISCGQLFDKRMPGLNAPLSMPCCYVGDVEGNRLVE